jgi:copper transporter 1
MDHGDMDHGHDHSGHGGHGDMDMGGQCSMNMIFTWDTTDLCIVFRQWHIRSTGSLIFSLAAVLLLAVGYEGLRSVSRKYEAAMAQRVQSMPRIVIDDEPITESTPFISGQNQPSATQRAHLIKAALYALQNFYAFMLMLVFMTYNGWVMLCVSLGAFVGYVVFGQDTSATKENACH